jgi:hypothetical protein
LIDRKTEGSEKENENRFHHIDSFAGHHHYKVAGDSLSEQSIAEVTVTLRVKKESADGLYNLSFSKAAMFIVGPIITMGIFIFGAGSAFALKSFAIESNTKAIEDMKGEYRKRLEEIDERFDQRAKVLLDFMLEIKTQLATIEAKLPEK